MIRTLSAIVIFGLAISVATAQQDPIAARKALMKDNGDQAKIGAAMVKGEAPFALRAAIGSCWAVATLTTSPIITVAVSVGIRCA